MLRLLLYVKSEENDIAVPDDVLLALDSYKAFISGRGVGTRIEKFLIVNDLSLDETALEIRMDLARRLRGLAADRDRPRPRLILAGRQIAHKAEQLIGSGDQLLETGLFDAKVGKELLLLLVIKLSDLLLDLSRDDEHFIAALLRDLTDSLHILVRFAVTNTS